MSVVAKPNSFRSGPDESGHFGAYGGRFVAETLMPLVLELERRLCASQGAIRHFQPSWMGCLQALCRPPEPALFRRAPDRSISAARRSISSARTSTTPARTRSTMCWARSCSRAAWARRASSPRPAPASMAWRPRRVCARFGLPCVVYMGAVDIERQKPNVFRMNLLGAEVRAGHVRLEDLEGCDERGVARLGRQCRRHLLHHRHGRGPASLSGDGARFPDA